MVNNESQLLIELLSLFQSVNGHEAIMSKYIRGFF